ncbi:MAG: hypothetical protein HOO06_09710 [Bdellovibrionaceae bacterium]|jgi:ribosomal protein RSM22 (predicted rRNA methylase)|nr:hypothetical protein [Pseudobdellovibrionaceae bacterium]
MNINYLAQDAYLFPEPVFESITRQLDTYGLPWNSKELKNAVISLSDHFNQNTTKTTLWDDKKYQAAYLAYFFPLNLMRILSLENELKSIIQENSDIVDFGSGPGTFSIASHLLKLAFKNLTCVEVNNLAIKLHQSLLNDLNINQPIQWENQLTANNKKKTGIFTYSLNELKQTPPWLFDFETLIILEPSTQYYGRRLQELREQLIENKYEILAPCTHQLPCALLHESKKDWCHQRIHIQMPKPWLDFEEKLPMTNRSLTFSYLIASKVHRNKNAGLGRVIGDTQKEKGKTKQAVCRSNEREFLSWLKKYKNAQRIARGSLVELDSGIEKKSNELRVSLNVI